MRAILVGPPRARERLRWQLAEVVGEFATASDARASGIDAEAIISAADRRRRFEADLEPGTEGIPDEALTPREQEVLELLAEGLPNKAIAERLRISDQTVKFHVASIMGKLEATNRVETVRRAVRRGLISL